MFLNCTCAKKLSEVESKSIEVGFTPSFITSTNTMVFGQSSDAQTKDSVLSIWAKPDQGWKKGKTAELCDRLVEMHDITVVNAKDKGYESAALVLWDVAQEMKTSWRAFYNSGVCFSFCGAERSLYAVLAFRKALELSPENNLVLAGVEDIFNNAREVLNQDKENSAARALCAHLALLKSEISKQSGDVAETERYMELALELFPDCEDTLVNVGNYFLNKPNQDLRKPIDIFFRVLKINRDCLEALVGLAKAFAAIGDFSGAVTYMTSPCRVQPKNEEWQFMLEDFRMRERGSSGIAFFETQMGGAKLTTLPSGHIEVLFEKDPSPEDISKFVNSVVLPNNALFGKSASFIFTHVRNPFYKRQV